jgi:uncharacterized OB-fold protein
VIVEHRAPFRSPESIPPYAVALVETDEGARMMTNIVDCDPNDVAVGDEVEVTWEALPDGRHLPLFRPVDPSADA